MKRICIAALCCVALAACNSDEHSEADGTVPGLPDRSVVVPPFNVTVDLTSDAAVDLKRRGETLRIAAAFIGGANARGARYAGHMGEIGWSDPQEIEMKGAGVARFGPRKLNLALLDYMKDRKPEVSIDVYSGRRTSTLNLLDCGIFEDSVYVAVKNGISIRCDLISKRRS